MLKKVKENKKLEIIQKINTFIAFCAMNGNKFEKENINIINKYINNSSDLDIYIMKIKGYCSLTVYFVDNTTQTELAKFMLPNIF